MTPLHPTTSWIGVDITLLIDLAMRSSLIVLVGLAVTAALRRQSAALRHSVLAAAMAGAAAVVPLSLVVPAWNVPMLARLPSIAASRDADVADTARRSRAIGTAIPLASTTAETAATTAAGATDTTAAPTQSGAGEKAVTTEGSALASRVALIWLIGVAVGATFLLTGVVHLLRVIARAERLRDGQWVHVADRVSQAYGLRRRVLLLHTDVPDLLATWGLFRPRVLLPAHAHGWSEDRIHAVLCHELAHIRRLDWFVQLAAEMLRTIYWFNPLIWIACARLRRESEQACDDAVLRAGVPGEDYAEHLLEVARTCRRAGPAWVSAVPMARPSTLERRITAMLNPGLKRAALSRRALAVTALLLLIVTLPIAAARARQTAPMTLTGAVYDPSGAVMPGVDVALESVPADRATPPKTARAITDSVGRFQFADVQPGSHDLQISVQGFHVLRKQLDLQEAKDWDRAFTLEVGHVQETIHVRAEAPAPATATAARPISPIRVGGNIRAPLKVQDVAPVYPESMRTAGQGGVVPLEAIIGRDGRVVSARVIGASVHPDFATAALEAVRQWRYQPTLLNGVPVEVVLVVGVTFSLE
jgi:TonB family protein